MCGVFFVYAAICAVRQCEARLKPGTIGALNCPLLCGAILALGRVSAAAAE